MQRSPAPARSLRGPSLTIFVVARRQAVHGWSFAFFGVNAGLAEPQAFAAFLVPLKRGEMGGPLEEAVRRARSGARLPIPLHPSRSDFEPPPNRRRCGEGIVQIQGLSPRRSRALQGHDAEQSTTSQARLRRVVCRAHSAKVSCGSHSEIFQGSTTIPLYTHQETWGAEPVQVLPIASEGTAPTSDPPGPANGREPL